MKAGLLAFSLLASGQVLGADWKLDPAPSRLEFIATFEKNAAPGVFKEFDTRLARFEPDKPRARSSTSRSDHERGHEKRRRQPRDPRPRVV
jgi:hypothetical protein